MTATPPPKSKTALAGRCLLVGVVQLLPRRILRQPSSQIEAILGWVDEPELIHRDNLVLLA